MTAAGPAAPLARAALPVPALRLHNRVLPVLIAAGAAAVLGTGFLNLAPNRLLSGAPVKLWTAADATLVALIGLCGALLLVVSLLPPRRTVYRAAALIAAILVLAILAAAGQGAMSIAAGGAPPARGAPRAGVRGPVGAAGLGLIAALQRGRAGRPARPRSAASPPP